MYAALRKNQAEKREYTLREPGWYRLDNAAKIYPATMQRDWNSIYRISAELDEGVLPGLLSQAAAELCARFPTFYVQLRRGFFWYYFEKAASCDVVREEDDFPCRPMEVGRGERPAFRILHYKKRVSLEVFHAVADGAGAMVYFSALLCRYFELRGHDMSAARSEVPYYRDEPTGAETEDSFGKYYDDTQKSDRKEPKAYRYRPRKEEGGYLRTVSGSFPADALKDLARKNGVTVTQFLSALYILALASTAPRGQRRPVRVSVPVNLRKLFPSETLRNFSLFANAGVIPREGMTPEDVLAEIVPQLDAGLKKERLLAVLSENVRAEKLLAVRAAPLFVKNIVLKINASLYGESRYTSPFSNMGVVKLPGCMAEHVEDVTFALGVTPTNAISATCGTYDGRTTVCFSSTSREAKVQAFFFKYLAESGVAVEVESNV